LEVANLNRVQLIGRLTRDPEVVSTQAGGSLTRFAVATNSYGRGKDGERVEYTDFHDVVCWDNEPRRLAQLAAQFLSKGQQVFVEGRLRTRDWTSDDGVRHFRTEVHAQDLQFLEKREKPAVVAGGQDDATDDIAF
jgi:single-strand DNA-binding protein